MPEEELVLFGNVLADGDPSFFIKPTLDCLIKDIPELESLEKRLAKSEALLRAPVSTAYYKSQIKSLERNELKYWEYYHDGYMDGINIYSFYTKSEHGLDVKLYIRAKDLILSPSRTIKGINNRFSSAVVTCVETLRDLGFISVNSIIKRIRKKQQVRSLIFKISEDEIENIGEGLVLIE